MGARPTNVQRVVGVGASGGGITAISTLLSGLPPGFPSPILIVQHLAPDFVSRLAEVLGRRTNYRVVPAASGTKPKANHAYIAQPDQHLTVDTAGIIQLTHAPRVHYTRPSVDVLFKSLASVFGKGVIGVILTGGGVDGADGAASIRREGGVVIAQSESTCEHYGMPGAVVQRGAADEILPLSEIASRIVQLTSVTHG